MADNGNGAAEFSRRGGGDEGVVFKALLNQQEVSATHEAWIPQSILRRCTHSESPSKIRAGRCLAFLLEKVRLIRRIGVVR